MIKEKNYGFMHTFDTINPETKEVESTEFVFEYLLTRRQAFKLVQTFQDYTLAKQQVKL